MALLSTKCTVDHKNTSYTFQNEEEKKTRQLFNSILLRRRCSCVINIQAVCHI